VGIKLRYEYKWTSNLTKEEIQEILLILNEAFEGWGNEAVFRWKYMDNPYGDSLHMIAYDGGQPVATVGFWRNGPVAITAYQCVDAAVRTSHQRRGIYQAALVGCSERLKNSYIYTFTSDDSRPAMMRVGWKLQRKLPLKFHLAHMVIRRYRDLEPISDEYANWRFVRNPKKEYYIYKRNDLTFLLDKRREHIYAVGGLVSEGLNLKEVRPFFLFSYDFTDLPFKIPRPAYYFIENPCYVSVKEKFSAHYSDTF